VYSSAVAAWTPADLGAALALWLDADDAGTITLNGTTVAQWDDKSGNGNHVLNGTASTQPEYLTTGWNGKPAVSFTQSGLEFLFKDGVSNFAANNDFTIASAFEYFQTNNAWDMIAGWRSAPNQATPPNGGTPVLQGMSNAPTQIGVHNTDRVDTRIKVDVTSRLGKKIATVGRSGGTEGVGGAVTVTSTGWSQPTYQTDGTQTWNSAAATGFQVGGRQQNGTAYGDKYISEVVGCNTKLSTENRQKLEGYLAWKWGLTYALPNGHPYKWDTSLFGGTNQDGFDADAKTYITAVETADVRDLEPAVREAINDFVVGCKADGIWTAIKASCIMAGARTLEGALVPLKGTAPTNFNFVLGDYNRKTGLVGDGSTKYLSSNRNNNTDPRNNKHLSTYITATATVGGDFLSSGNGGGHSRLGSNVTALLATINTSSQYVGASAPLGFAGASRSISTSFDVRDNSVTFTHTAGSTNTQNSIISVFNRASTSGYVDTRIAFYSIGESLDLAQLDARVTTLINAYGAILDADAQAYITAVETADAQALEPAVREAINDFVVGCKADGIWTAIKACCILAGARTLEGALVPLKGTAPTNFNFVLGDYNRNVGLVGDGSTKYLDANRNSNIDGQNDHHMSIYVSTLPSIGNSYIGSGISPGSNIGVGFSRSRSDTAIGGLSSHVGFIGVSRSTSSSYIDRRSGTNANPVITSSPPTPGLNTVFARGSLLVGTSHSNTRIAFYSLGESLDLALLDARVTTLINAYGAI
jgi:hypothetical protein